MAALPQRKEQTRSAGVKYALDIVNLSKSFKRATHTKGGYSSIKSAIVNLFSGREKKQSPFHRPVIKDLTLRIPQGSSVGIIGRNGAGKSTLLKLISGIYRPTSGSVAVNGRIAALIELGAGFHPDFTGRENLLLGGIMHGLTEREIKGRLDEIIAFAELEAVIDEPVRTYSSGMYMRLGFSLAIHTDPDILIIDEVLAVGDAVFVNKCKERISELRREGKTLLLVTHDLGAVERWCDEALWLHQGEVFERGNPRRVIDAYLQFVEKDEEAELIAGEQQSQLAPSPDHEKPERWGSREVEISSIQLLDSQGKDHRVFHSNDSVRVAMRYKFNEPTSDLVFGVGIHRADGVQIFGTNTDIERIKLPELGTTGEVHFDIKRLGLLDGNYTLDVAAHRSDGYPYDYHQRAIKFSVRWPEKQVGVCLPEHSWSFKR